MLKNFFVGQMGEWMGWDERESEMEGAREGGGLTWSFLSDQIVI